jgi:L-alanine-DL-glutamate epimerase-like enolase superfamily enzyme
MKITKIESLVVRSPHDRAPESSLVGMSPIGTTTGGTGLWRKLDLDYPAYPSGHTQFTLVKISTDENITGWGQCHAPLAPHVHVALISDLLAPVLIGEDPRNVEVLWERMYSTQRLRGYDSGFFIQSIAGIDLALWDILGKALQVPVYRLLGGKYRDQIPTYLWLKGDSGESYAESARAAFASGYTAVKMNVHKIDDLDFVTAVSKIIGSRGQVFVVATGLKLYEAIKIGRELDRLGNVGWLQEPLLPEDALGYRELTKAIDTPVCYGAFLANRFHFRDAFASESVDIINPDICYCGGLSECRKIAALADVYGVLWSPHVSMVSPISMAASLHLAAATPNFVILENADQSKAPLGNVLLKRPLEYFPGYAKVPETPGLGVEFDEQRLAELAVN